MTMKVIYKDYCDNIQEVIVTIPEESYREGMAYKDCVDEAIEDIMQTGGFWLNDTTVIPSHKIQSFHTHQLNKQLTKQSREPKIKPKRNRRPKHKPRRYNSNENNIPVGDKVPQASGDPGRKD